MLLIVGLGLGAAVAPGPLTIGGVSFDVDTLVALRRMAVDIGFQAVLFWLFTQVYAGAEGFLPEEPRCSACSASCHSSAACWSARRWASRASSA